MESPTDARGLILAASKAAEAELARLKEATEEEEKWRKLLEAVTSNEAAAPAATCDVLHKQTDILRNRERTHETVVEALRAVYVRCSERANAAAKESVRTFVIEAEAHGLPLDRSSRHPRYSFYDHTLQVELDERGLRADIHVRHGERVRMALDVPAVVARLSEERDRLFNRDWQAASFLAAMRKAYRPLSKNTEKVPLKELAAAMSKARKPRLDEFAVDLGRFLREPLAETGPTRVSVDQTRDTKSGLQLYGFYNHGYYLTVTMEERA